MTLRSDDITLQYKIGNDLDEEITKIARYGKVMDDGTFAFNMCDVCNGPVLGHVWDNDNKCVYEIPWTREEAQSMANEIVKQDEYEEAVFKLRVKEDDVTCSFCNKQQENRWAKKEHYKKVHKRELNKENNDYMITAVEQLKDDRDELVKNNKNMILLMEKLVDAEVT